METNHEMDAAANDAQASQAAGIGTADVADSDMDASADRSQDDSAIAAQRSQRPWYRPRWRPRLLRLHRWTSFVSIILVAVFFISGAIVMYSDDALQFAQSDAYHATDTGHLISTTDALAAANAATPDYQTWSMSLDRDVYIAFQLDADANSYYTFVDGGTGKVNATLTEAEIDADAWPWLRRLAWNAHVCAFSCADMPLHLSFMEGKLPIIGWRWKSTALMLTSLAAIFLAVSGLVMWWPGLRHWRKGFRLRRTNLTTISVDGHRILGAVSVVWFVMWGLSGIAYALPDSTERLWHDVTGGVNANMDLQMRAADAYATPGSGAEVSLADAQRIALDAKPGTKFASVILPLPGNAFGLGEAFYDFALTDAHLDPWGFVAYGGGSQHVIVGLHGEPTLETDDGVATSLWSNWRHGLHDGFMVNPWWRSMWLFFALSPVLFALTGVTMWWRRRRNRAGRRADQSAVVAADTV